ncbi:MAG: hydantoinase B/oxoprolinase family protein [Rhizobiaceae bacterium]
MTKTAMDGIELEVLWSNLRSIVSERAKAMQRTAFSPLVRDAGDLAYALFDGRGRMVAQADTGTPGHINCLARTALYLVEEFAGRLEDGDVLITNDPWLGAGHFFDIIIFSPIFFEDRIIGYVGSNNHHTDIGGSGIGAGASDVHEEGLWIPPAKLYEAGRRNELLHRIILRNVRTPDHVGGDLAAQVSANRAGGEALVELCRNHGLADIEQLSDEIIDRSERATRSAIRALKPGSWTGETEFDIPGGEIVRLRAKVTVDTDLGEIGIDFTGSSSQVKKGVNVVLAYTQAYAMFTVRSCLNPQLPNNTGSLRPIRVTAPEGSIVNCLYPAPVNARHVVGMYVPMPILKALYNVIPDRVLAESPGGAWAAQVMGATDQDVPFVSTLFAFAGGMGARAAKRGLDATFYPTGIASTPIEIVEAGAPVVFRCKELRPGSGGQGRNAGGDGQVVEFTVRSAHPWTINAMTSGTKVRPSGIAGGEPGAPGRLFVNGEETMLSGKAIMQPGDVVRMETPGGGGFGALAVE